MLAGGVTAGVEDAGHAVGRFHGQGYLSVKGIEGDAVVHEVGDTVRGLAGQDAHRLLVGKAAAGFEGILNV